MQITRNSLDTSAGPSDWFTGTVYVDAITTPSGDWRIGAASVHFTPRRPDRLAHAPVRPDDLGHRRGRPLPP